MDAPSQADTLSGRFHGQWAFLSNPPPPPNHGQARSLPPSSSYLRSDRSSASPRVAVLPFHHGNASRSSLNRNNKTASVGAHSYGSATTPSQPVLLRINSDVASSHILDPSPRNPRRTGIMSRPDQLPPLSAFSFDGILGSIQEVIEEDLNGIAEIMGRSRLVLADQHDSHLPPTGEIRAGLLPALAEASSSNERLAGDDVMILDENASLIDGSHAGSAAYGLLERLQAVPRTRRMHSDFPTSYARSSMSGTEARVLTPTIPTDVIDSPTSPPPEGSQSSRKPSSSLLRLTSAGAATTTEAPTAAVVSSEVWLSAGSKGQFSIPIVSEAGKHFALYSYDESQIFEAEDPQQSPGPSFAARMQRLVLLKDLQGALAWTLGHRSRDTASGGSSSDAESQLRDILGKHPAEPVGESSLHPPAGESQDMYE
ncbi:uncharacterized protein HMPREF1541_08649 [Cyphellophora europaea CBS 101466]|uniref:Uncharacterized protein n=1 Tax=Cyphellophora europaea (strain CBS 101466) TaxID=1220924 RepID=W2RIS5_CYPE1|nr:uncharacterized protein HMPREF1541_08649 [Cyphellophora europaea CBS 101466]ETN36372.1 hypothetical protein HMPREF1541_08649 [Cyphellophora europaea CBS 101466]